MCSFVVPAFDGMFVYKQLMASCRRERYRLACAVKTQDADAVIAKFPPVNPAILSEYGIQKQGFFRMRGLGL